MADAAELVEENDVMVPMRDGIRLRTDVFRPATGGPHPVLVQRYPYSPRDGFGAMFGRHDRRPGLRRGRPELPRPLRLRRRLLPDPP